MTTVPDQIRTERLVLACWRADDAPLMRAALDECDAHLRPWIPFMQGEPRSLDETRAKLIEARDSFANGEHFRYAIRERTTGALVGETMLLSRGGPDTLEAGYWLHRDHCGKGYATEATRALLPIAFDVVGVGRVILRCDERNRPSIRVAERLGATRIGVEDDGATGERVRLLVFGLTKPG